MFSLYLKDSMLIEDLVQIGLIEENAEKTLIACFPHPQWLLLSEEDSFINISQLK